MKCGRWNQIADMNKCRNCAACTVYEGKIIVSGGWNNDGLNSVETYDFMKTNGLIFLIC